MMVELLTQARDTLSQQLRPSQTEFWFAFGPVICYWAIACFYDVLDHLPWKCVAKHRIARKDPDPSRFNRVSRTHVCLRVLLQHGFQVLATLVALVLEPTHCSAAQPVGWARSCLKFVIAMFIMDTWQYWIHRVMHTSRYLYKNFHSTHHQLWVPYAFGALYNHPLEALLLDTLGATICHFSLSMTCQLAVTFFCFSTTKTVLDHCNYRAPINPLHDLLPNSAAYHDVHHDFHGLKANYSQPFFVFWDIIMGTYMDPSRLQLSPKEAAEAASAAPSRSPSLEKGFSQAAGGEAKAGGAVRRRRQGKDGASGLANGVAHLHEQ